MIIIYIMADISSKRKYSFDSMYPNPQKYNLKYWERMQKVLDAKTTRAQNLLLRHKWIERQNKMNYQNEYDRLRGEMSYMPPGLIKHAIEGMMPKEKLAQVTQYDVEKSKPKGPSKSKSAQTSKVPSRAGSDADSETSVGKQQQQQRTLRSLWGWGSKKSGVASSSSGAK